MVKIHGREILDKDTMLMLLAEGLSGNCTARENDIFNYPEYTEGVKFFNITPDEFSDYLQEKGIFECDACGWWTYEGEGINGICDECEDLEYDE
jgi:hypothetical protein